MVVETSGEALNPAGMIVVVVGLCDLLLVLVAVVVERQGRGRRGYPDFLAHLRIILLLGDGRI